MDSMSSGSSCGIMGMVRKSKEFRFGVLSRPWRERRVEGLLDFGVTTCGVYYKCSFMFEGNEREMSGRCCMENCGFGTPD